jgi:hypothetical protein
MTQDDPAVCEFMRTHNTREVLSNVSLWGQDLSHLTDEVEKYVNK